MTEQVEVNEQEELELARRAYAAYYRAGGVEKPDDAASGVRRSRAHLKYIVLKNSAGVLAVYRVRNDGVLKGMKRWPAEILT